jgi:hypothetical protein
MFTIERQGYNTVREMTLAVVNDLVAHGFAVKYPLTNDVYEPPTTDAFKIILETSSSESNILNAGQPWRIAFEILDTTNAKPSQPALGDARILACYTGTSANLADNGTVACSLYAYQYQLLKNEPFGNIGSEWTNKGQANNSDATPDHTSYSDGFMNRFLIENQGMGGTRPLSYRLSITTRGIFLGVWDTRTEETATAFNWMLIQRSVDKDSGATRGTTPATSASTCPVFCVNSVNNGIYKFIVREKDVFGPSARKINDADAEDSPAPLNPEKQVCFNEDGNYVITLLNNLTTPRFKYTDELDMVGTISADVVGAGQELEFTVYGEAQPRKYLALQANKPNNTGMRLMVLIDNPNE